MDLETLAQQCADQERCVSRAADGWGESAAILVACTRGYPIGVSRAGTSGHYYDGSEDYLHPPGGVIGARGSAASGALNEVCDLGGQGCGPARQGADW
jgi:hypothetical protein